MANQKLSLTRDQFASFLQDFEQIKQFERLFATVDSSTNDTIPGIEIAAGNAGESANDALAQITALSETLNLAPPANLGTVTSVAASGGTTGLTFSGSPITDSGTLTLGGTLAIANGGTGATAAATAITNLGATTLGGNMFTLVNPSAITFPRFNADNTVSALDAATFRTAIGAGTGSGTVTSVSGTGTVNGLTLTGTVTTSGSLTLGGTLSGIANSALTNSSITINGSAISLGGSVSVGTVTSASVATANGFAGTVATATTTPSITLSTTITGVLKGNGAALSAAVAATDYVAPSAYASTNGLTMATGRLLGRTTASTGAAEEISVAGGLTLSGGVLTGASGTVTSVTGTSPVVSSGGTTPAISMPAATASVNGYLTSTDWTTFNSKGSGTVTSVSGTGTVNGITLTGTVTSSGSLTLGGTLSGVSLTTQVSGTLPIANGGTGTATAFTVGSVVFAGASGVYTQDNANLFWDNTNDRLGIGTASPAYRLDVSGVARAFESASAGTSNLISANTSTANNTTKYTSLLFQGVDTIGTLKSAGLVLSGPADVNYVGSYMAFQTRISDAVAERMRIDNNGYLLVGTTSSEGPARISSVSTASGTACVSYRNSAGAGSYLALFINAANSAFIGSITNDANTGVLYNITSDVRLKENISDADDAASLIDALQVRKFDWKGSSVHQRYGFVAQELLGVAPEAVYQPENPEDMMAVDYSKLVPMLVKELQSLRARVAQLEGE